MRHFLVVYNLVQKNFYGQRDHPLGHLPFKYHSPKTIHRGGISSQTTPIFGQGTQSETFWSYYTIIHTISVEFLGYKSSKKDKNMISCTRLYVESTETLTDQGRKRRILSHLKQWWENIRGQNLILIFTNKKDTKLSLIGEHFRALWTLLIPLRDFSHWSLPTPWSPPHPRLVLFPSVENHRDTPQKF